jgi:ethylene-insensitive protein 3
MISSLMLGYDTNVIGNNNASSTNCVVIENQNLSQPIIQQQQNLSQPIIQQQQDNFFLNQGMVMEANFFTREENQFDRVKAMNSPFETNLNNNNNMHPMYGSSCDLASFDFKEDLQLQGGVGMDALYKQQDVSIWNY